MTEDPVEYHGSCSLLACSVIITGVGDDDGEKGGRYSVSPSQGIAVWPPNHTTVRALLSSCDSTWRSSLFRQCLLLTPN